MSNESIFPFKSLNSTSDVSCQVWIMDLYTYACSPVPPLIFGVGSLAQGLRAFLRPRHEHAWYFGLPPPTTSDTSIVRRKTNESVQQRYKQEQQIQQQQQYGDKQKPFAYFKGIRDITCGLLLIGANYQGHAMAVTMVSLVWAELAVGDALVVWYNGGRSYGLSLLAGSLGFAWVGLRSFLAYGEWAAFLALHC